MRLYLPERIPVSWTVVIAAIFFAVQMLQHTSFTFAILHFCFIVCWMLAFNAAGGFTRSTGGYVFWYGLLTIVVGTITKAIIGDPADSNMTNPIAMMGIYTVSMVMLLAVVALTHRLLGKTESVAAIMQKHQPLNYRRAAWGCFALGMSVPVLFLVLPSGPGTLLSALTQVDLFLPLSVILGTIAVIQESNGHRSIGAVSLIPILCALFWGIATFSKQGMFEPLVCWGIGAAYMRFRLRLVHLTVLAVTTFVSFYVLVPISQVGRDLVTPQFNYVQRMEVAVYMLEHLSEYRATYEGTNKLSHETNDDYFSRDVGMASRFTRIPGDSKLISFSLAGHYLNYGGIWSSFLNWVPHFIMPNKQKYMDLDFSGNYYAREMGGLSPDDTTTGISFGSSAEIFHLGGWNGILLMLPFLWFLLFFSIEILCGDVRKSPWGLFYIMIFSHMAPETGIAGIVYFIWFANVGLLFCMVVSTYLAPLLGALITGTHERRRGLRSLPIPAPTVLSSYE